MKSVKWFFTLQFSLLRNSYWRDRKTTSRTFFILLVIAGVLYALTQLFYRSIQNSLNLTGLLPVEFVFLLFLVIVIWIFLIAFIQSIGSFTKTFYRSPEMNYLVALPIPLNHLFLFNFFKHTFASNKSMLVLLIPFLASIGLLIEASIWYYLTIIPIYFFLTIITSGLGVIIALLGSKLLSNHIFSLVATFMSLAINVGFAVLFTRSDALLTRFGGHIERLFESDLFVDLMPVTAASRLFISMTGIAFYPLAVVSLIVTTLLVVIIVSNFAKFHYFAGWEKTQIAASKTVTRKKGYAIKEGDMQRLQLIAHWFLHEWKMAVRNTDMFIAAFSMLSFYLLAALAFTAGQLFADDAIVGVGLLITVATLFNIMAVSIPFLPADISKDKSLWKGRYWLLKVMPFNEQHVLWIQTFMYFIPAATISLIGLIAYVIAINLSFAGMVVSVLAMLTILFVAALLYVSTELLSLSAYFEKNALLGNVMTFVVPFGYALLTAGLVTLFFAQGYVADLPVFERFVEYLSLALVIPIASVTFITALGFSVKTTMKVWRYLEI